MSAQHPSRSYKGCALCKPQKRRGLGEQRALPVRDVRRLGGRRGVKRGGFE